MQGIFARNARKYWEMGLNVIPLKQKHVPANPEKGTPEIPEGPHGKAAFTPKWQEYSYKRQTEEELEYFINEFPENNIGIVCGVASGVVCLDIDTEELLDKLPRSPVTRKGKKGEGRFFKYPKGIELFTKHFGKPTCVDVQGIGAQVAIPDSIHPETKEPYVWLSENWDDIEEFPTTLIADLQKLHDGLYKEAAKNGEDVKEGRANYFTKYITAALLNDEWCDPRFLVSKIIELDRKNYRENPYFSDPSEWSGRFTPEQNVQKMVASVQQTLARAGKLPQPRMPVVQKPHKKNEVPEKPKLVWTPPMPESGLLRLAYDYQYDRANDDLPLIFLGGAIAFISALCGNKFVCEGISPNVSVLIVSGSGAGKSWPFRMVEKFLTKHKILCDQKIQSGTMLMKGFGDYPWRTRLDKHEEAGQLLGMIKKGGVHQTNMMQVLCELWSGADREIQGIAYSDAAKSVGSCWNPYHVMLMGTTPVDLEATAMKEWNGGLFPRLLVCYENRELGFKRRMPASEAESFIWEAVERLMAMEERKEQVVFDRDRQVPPVPDSAKFKYNPINLPLTPDADEFWYELQRRYRVEEIKRLQDNFGGYGGAYAARWGEHVMKLAIIHAVSKNLDCTQMIELEDLKWGQEVVEGLFAKANELLEDIYSDGFWGKVGRELEKFIREKGTVSKSEILKRFYGRGWHADTLNKMLDSLVMSEKVSLREDPSKRGKKGRSADVYVWGNDDDEIGAAPGQSVILGDA